jgi:hypothetical protein
VFTGEVADVDGAPSVTLLTDAPALNRMTCSRISDWAWLWLV